MKQDYIPETYAEAAIFIREVLCERSRITAISQTQFCRGWASMCFMAPGLHPDGFEESDSGWPVGWRPVAAEAFRRSEAGLLLDCELYPAAASHAGLAFAA